MTRMFKLPGKNRAKLKRDTGPPFKYANNRSQAFGFPQESHPRRKKRLKPAASLRTYLSGQTSQGSEHFAKESGAEPRRGQ